MLESSARLLATVVVLTHLAFVAFVVAGGVLALRWPRAAWLHLPAAAWGALIALAGFICPLTPLENWLRVRGGTPAYDTGFLEHYLLPVLYPVTMTRQLQLVTGVFVVVLNALVYWRVLRRRRRVAGTGMARGWMNAREVKDVQDPDSG
jgi:hypothetical protein